MDPHIRLLLDHLQRADQTLTAAINEAARAGLTNTAHSIDDNRADLERIRAGVAETVR